MQVKKLIFLFASLLAALSFRGQSNLVPNPSFESVINCPTNIGQLYNTSDWIDPTSCTSDYFHQCGTSGSGVPNNAFGSEMARTGQGYAGFYTYNSSTSDLREFIQVKLIDTLESGKKYLVSFWVSLADNLHYATRTIGAYFSSTPVSGPPCTLLPFTPQILNDTNNPLTSKTGWREVTDTLFATGGELYITIGNFSDDANSDTVFVGGAGWDGSHYFIDDISVVDIGWVGTNEQLINDYGVNVYPNPAEGQITLDFKSIPQPGGDLRIEFYDALGRRVGEKQLDKSLRSQEISVADLQEGIYLFRIICNDAICYTNRLLICR